MPRLRVKKAWFMADTSVFTTPTSFMRTKSGTRKKRRPSFAPSMNRLLMARMTMMMSRAIIMTLVTRSRPLCRPLAHTRMPRATTNTIQKVMTPGFASISVNFPATWSASRPASLPVAVM